MNKWIVAVLSIVVGMSAMGGVIFEDDFSSFANGASLGGTNWYQKWDEGFGQTNLMTVTDGVVELDTTVAIRNYFCPSQTGFTVGSNDIYVVTDCQYVYEGGGAITNSLNEPAFGLYFSTSSNWWEGTKIGNSMCNRGKAIGHRRVAVPWVAGWVTHSSLGVNTANADTSIWFKVANRLVSSNATVWLQTMYFDADDEYLEAPFFVDSLQDTGVSNDIPIYAGYNTGWNSVGNTNIASFSKITQVNYDNFYVGTKPEADFETFYNWTLETFWIPHNLYTALGWDYLNQTIYWCMTTNAAYADPNDRFAQHRPGLFDTLEGGQRYGGVGYRGYYLTNSVRSLAEGESYEVVFDYKLFVDGLEDETFMDCFFSTNGSNEGKWMGYTGTELGFSLRQSALSSSPETTNGFFNVGFDSIDPMSQMFSMSLPDLGLTVVDEGAGIDHEGDDLVVLYTARKTSIAPWFECKMSVSNTATQAVLDSGSMLVSNATAYAASELWFCVYTPNDLSNGQVGLGINTAGYELDNMNGRILYTPPPAAVTVYSEIGTPVPTIGTTEYNMETNVAFSVASPVWVENTNYVSAGWVGTGSIPASGSGNNTGGITLYTSESSIEWLWAVDHVVQYVDISIAGIGTVNISDGWYREGTNLSLVTSSDGGWLFAGWSGDLTGDYSATNANLLVDSAKSITATFSTDVDGDGLSNVDEAIEGTDPYNDDSDSDGLLDGEELNTYGTSPIRSDSDNDGLSDGFEVTTNGVDNLYLTDPLDYDSDNDGTSDGYEIQLGFNPLDPNDDPDKDEDQILDSWERDNFGNIILCDPEDDPDNDLYTNLEEFNNGTDPNVMDTFVEMYPAFEITWKAVAGTNYQVQANTNIPGGTWSDIGETVMGTGSRTGVLVRTRNADSKMFRIEIQP